MTKTNNNIFMIYIHKNKLNNKKYIGATQQKPSKRWGKNGNGYKSQILFYRAIQKYGWNNFEHIVLFSRLSKQEAEDIETELIAYHKSNMPKYGYNIANGGNCSGKCSEITRKKLSNILKGRKLSSEQLQNIKDANGKKIICLETKEIFQTINEASEKLNINRYSISMACNKKSKTAYNLHFLFLDEYDENYKYNLKPHKREIICINTGEVFSSIRGASRKLKINSGDICNICKGKFKHINGISFKYLGEIYG